MKVTCFLSDAYGSFGGIARFNRDFLDALDRCAIVKRVIVFPRVIPHKDYRETIPNTISFIEKAANGKFSYVVSIVKSVISESSPKFVVCGHINLLPIAYLYARILRRKLVLIVHGIDAWTPNRSFTNRLVSHVDLVVSVSMFTARRLISWAHVSEDKIFVLPNCVDLERFVPLPRDAAVRQRFGWTDRHRVLMTLGRLANAERYKGFDEVIDVLPDLVRRNTDIRYLIVGDGSDRTRLINKVQALGLEDVVAFAGQIEDDERISFYNAADLYVMPSRGEGFGIVLLEAAACGLSIIGSAVDGSLEALLHGKLGLVIDPSDHETLKRAVLDRLSLDTGRTRSEAINHFSQEAYRKRVETLILHIVDAGRSSDASSAVEPHARTRALP